MKELAVDQLSGIRESRLADTRIPVDDLTTRGHQHSRLNLQPRHRVQLRLKLQKRQQPRLQSLQKDPPQRNLQMTMTMMMTTTSNVPTDMECLLIESVGNFGTAST